MVIIMNNFRCVKSVITILLITALVILSFVYPETFSETIKNAVTMVVTFYFAHQQKKEGGKNA